MIENWGRRIFQKYRVERPQNQPRKTHFFLPGAPFSGSQINFSYLGFSSSVSGHLKLIGPGYGLFGPLYSILWPIVTIQYRCDTSRDVLWCHDFGPTAPLRPQNLKLCTLTSVGSWSSFQGTQDLYKLSIGKYIQCHDLLWQSSTVVTSPVT